MPTQSKTATARENLEKAQKLKGQGNIEGAIEKYQAALQINPDFLPALEELADLYIKQGEFDRAAACNNRAIELRWSDFFAVPIDSKKETVKPPNIDELKKRLMMPAKAQDVVSELLAKSKCFLEYGAGGSTILAAARGVNHVYSVESDQAFFQDIERQINEMNTKSKFHPVYVDLGKTGKFGYPEDKSKVKAWPNYPTNVWHRLSQEGQTPDLILVDGRFRVACFLASLLSCQTGTYLMFDDYYDRPHYHVAEKYAKVVRKVGRLAIFLLENSFDCQSVAFDLAKYSIDTR
jgi:tetratricopeptide (TPR) repeat protein